MHMFWNCDKIEAFWKMVHAKDFKEFDPVFIYLFFYLYCDAVDEEIYALNIYKYLAKM